MPRTAEKTRENKVYHNFINTCQYCSKLISLSSSILTSIYDHKSTVWVLMSKLKNSGVAGCRYKQIYLKYEWWCLKHHIWWVGRVAPSLEMHRTLQRDSWMCFWGAPSDPDQLILLWNMYFPNLHSLHRHNEIEYDELVVKIPNQGTKPDHNFLTNKTKKINRKSIKRYSQYHNKKLQ